MGTRLVFDTIHTGTALTEIDLPDALTWADVADYGVKHGQLWLTLRDGRALECPIDIEMMKDPDNITVLDGETEAVLAER